MRDERKEPGVSADYWELVCGKPMGSFVGEYMNIPVFEVDKLPDTTYQRLNFGPELT